MPRFKDKCRQCGREFDNYDAGYLRYCCLGCERDALFSTGFDNRSTYPHWLTDGEVSKLGECSPVDDLAYPIREYGASWYYWDESWAYCFGPFDTEKEAKKSLKQYGDSL